MNLNSEQTLTEYAVARNEYKAATIEARAFVECSINRARSGFLAGVMAVEKPLNQSLVVRGACSCWSTGSRRVDHL